MFTFKISSWAEFTYCLSQLQTQKHQDVCSIGLARFTCVECGEKGALAVESSLGLLGGSCLAMRNWFWTCLLIPVRNIWHFGSSTSLFCFINHRKNYGIVQISLFSWLGCCVFLALFLLPKSVCFSSSFECNHTYGLYSSEINSFHLNPVLMFLLVHSLFHAWPGLFDLVGW